MANYKEKKMDSTLTSNPTTISIAVILLLQCMTNIDNEI